MKTKLLLILFVFLSSQTAIFAQADLITQNFSMSPNPVSPNGNLSISFNVRNQGNVSSNSCTTRIRINQSSSNVLTTDPIIATFTTPALGVNGSTNHSTNYTVPGNYSGTYYVWVILDVNSTAGQSAATELNDRTNYQLIVSAPGNSDLVAQSFSMSPNPVSPNGNLSISFNVRNQGNASANSSTTNVRINQSSSNVTTGDPLIATFNTPALATNASTNHSTNYTVPGNYSGTYYVWVIVDAYSTAGQGLTNELNDKTNYQLQVTATCTYSLSSSSYSFPSSAAGSNSVSLTTQSGCPWTASSNNSWITITSSTTGTGSSTINYSVTSNPNTTQRTGTLTIQGNTFTVTQPGLNCTYSLSSSGYTFASSSAGSNSVNLTTQSGCAWTASSNAGWLTITSPTSGSGSSTINYSVSANPNSTLRTGTLTIQGNTYTVSQPGLNCSYTLNPSFASLSSSASSGNIFVVNTQTGCSWTASPNDSWINITSGTSGTGTGTVTYSVIANPNTTPITGSITAGGQTFTINQSGTAAMPDLSITLPANPVNIYNLVPLASTQISYIIHNTGNAIAGNSISSFFLSSDNVFNASIDTWIEDDYIPSLPSTGSAPRTVTVTIPTGTPVGTWYILIISDAPNSVVESSETNNLSFVSVNVNTALQCISDNYPYPPYWGPYGDCNTNVTGYGSDAWEFFKYQCTSYAAWKVNEFHGATTTNLTSAQYPLYNHLYDTAYNDNSMGCLTTGPDFRLSDACRWDDVFLANGILVNNIPAVGAIAQWDPDFGHQEMGAAGHVGFVNSVSGNSVCISNYNGWNGTTFTPCQYGYFQVDNSLAYSYPNNLTPDHYIHVEASGLGSGSANGIQQADLKFASFSIYPNPNNGSFTIALENIPAEPVQIKIFNVLGDVIFASSPETVTGIYLKEINLDEKQAGLYFVQIQIADKIESKKILIQ